jgi:hypothetical protein
MDFCSSYPCSRRGAKTSRGCKPSPSQATGANCVLLVSSDHPSRVGIVAYPPTNMVIIAESMPRYEHFLNF